MQKYRTKAPELDLNLLSNFFEQEEEVVFAYLFGSYATGQIGPMSDVDVAVYLDMEDKTKRFDKRCNLIGKLTSVLKRDDLDLIVLNDTCDSFLLHDVFTEGKLLFCRDEDKHFDYIVKKQHEVLDFLTRYFYVNSRKNRDKNA